MKRKFLILICLILFIVSVAAVSAADDANQTISDDTLSISKDVNVISAKDDGTFTALQEKIDNAQEGSTINLENDYEYDDGFKKTGISISKNLTIDGKGHTIDALYTARIFDIKSSNIILNNIEFQKGYTSDNGGFIQFLDGSLSVNDCNFDGSSSKTLGGAIWALDGSLNVANCSFGVCSAEYGGAIDSSASLSVNDCIFVDCSADGEFGMGGAIYAEDCIVANCSFANSHADYMGGAIRGYGTIIDCSFVNCHADSGGAISDCSVVNGCSFEYCSANRGGGAISVCKNVNDCSFVNCHADSGGAIASGDVNGCSFVNCYASKGGAIDYSNEITNSNFTNCSASNDGGAIYAEDCNCIITNCRFVDCHASNDGGAIFSSDTVNNCYFVNCHASKGGAIYNIYGHEFTNSNFTDNSADFGGAIYFELSRFRIDKCNFNNNFANDGGAIYFNKELSHGWGSLTTYLNNLEFNNNIPNIYGGAIAFSENILYLNGYYNDYNIDVYITGDVSLNIAGKSFKRAFDSKGKTSFDLSSIPSGTWNANISYKGDYNFGAFEINLPITIESSTVLDVPDVTKNYSGPENLEITLTDGGSPVANAKVNININGGDYTRTTDSNGKASMPINLNAGSYDAIVSYGDVSVTAKVTVNKLASETSLAYTKNAHNSVTLTASVNPSSAGGKVTFNVNGKDYPATVSDAKATYTLNNLAVGSYDAKATYQGDVNHKSSSSDNVKFTVEEQSIIVSAPDVTKYYGGDERFVVTVTDNAGKPIANEPVKVTINGQVYDRKTGADGRTTFAINLRSGTHEATTEHAGEVIKSKITVKTTVISKDVTKIFRNGTNYEASFLDKNGNKAPAGGKVSININGVFYQRTIKSDGSISFALNLEQGTYVLTMTNPYTGEEISNTVKILPNIVDNKDLTKYYRNGSQFTFKLLDDKGKPAAGQKASININGVFYSRTANDKGIATFQINLEPGTYVLTMEYKGCRVSNKVTVLSVIKSSDIKMKYQDGTRFKVTILDGVGKPYAKQNVTFNINGVFYYRTTKDDGSASLAINLMAGEYIITTTYNSLNVSNKVTIAG